MNLEVSVALATYNGSRFLATQLRSLAQQTLPPAEIVISDDGSSDDTLAVCRGFMSSACIPVRIFESGERKGYRANFMKAADRCSSELVAFCDQDDYWHPTKLAVLARHLADTPALQLVSHDARLVDENGADLGATLLGPAALLDRPRPGLTPPWTYPLGFTQVFRRSLLKYSHLRESTVDFFDPSQPLAHDQWIPLIAGVVGRRSTLPIVLADYRQHSANAFGIRAPRRRDPIKRVRDRLLRQGDYGLLAASFRSIANAFSKEPDLVWAAEVFADGASLYTRRQAVYRGKTLKARVAAWLHAYQEGDYSPRHRAHLRKAALVQDLLLGALVSEKAKAFDGPIEQRDPLIRLR